MTTARRACRAFVLQDLKVVYDDHMKGKNHAAKVNKLTLLFGNFPKLSTA